MSYNDYFDDEEKDYPKKGPTIDKQKNEQPN